MSIDSRSVLNSEMKKSVSALWSVKTWNLQSLRKCWKCLIVTDGEELASKSAIPRLQGSKLLRKERKRLPSLSDELLKDASTATSDASTTTRGIAKEIYEKHHLGKSILGSSKTSGVVHERAAEKDLKWKTHEWLRLLKDLLEAEVSKHNVE